MSYTATYMYKKRYILKSEMTLAYVPIMMPVFDQNYLHYKILRDPNSKYFEF